MYCSLSNMELMLFICCYSGAGGEYGNNFPANCVEMGAEVTVGFTDTIYCGQSNEWCQQFFYNSKRGFTVEEITEILNDGDYNFDESNMGTNNIVICGNGNYILNGF